MHFRSGHLPVIPIPDIVATCRSGVVVEGVREKERKGREKKLIECYMAATLLRHIIVRCVWGVGVVSGWAGDDISIERKNKSTSEVKNTLFSESAIH